jgi:cytochrome d ubiquinol oxidase subunit II
MLILFALILRGVAFEFRGKVESPGWRKLWDTCIFIGSFAPALLFGVAFANIFQGIPIDQKGVYQGTLFTLLNPCGLIGGVLFVLLFLVHGALWLAAKTQGALQARAVSAAAKIWPAEVVVAVVFLAASYFTTNLYSNYMANPLLFAVILLTVAALFGIRVFLAQKAFFKAWFASALTIVGATFYGVIGLFPNMFPSSLNPAWSLTAHNASSTQLTLTIMLVVVVIFVPIVLVYQAWAYNLFKTKVTAEDMMY